MALSSSLATVRYYTQADPYYYTVDNRPLSDLATRDVTLADELDKRVNMVRIVGTSTPAISNAPTGWTVAYNSTGDFTINHALGSANIMAVGTSEATITFVTVFTITSTQIRVRIYDAAGALTNSNFALIVSRYA